MRIVMQAEHHEAHVSLHHQGLWFILLLIVILLLLSKNVATHLPSAGYGGQASDDQWVMAYNSTLIPIA